MDVTLLHSRDRLMEFVDREIVETLTYHMRKTNMTWRLGEAVARAFFNRHYRQ